MSIILATKIDKFQILQWKCRIFHFLQFCREDGNLNEEGGNFLGGKKEEWEEGGGILGAGSLGEDMVTGWKLRSEEETEYQTDIFS